MQDPRGCTCAFSFLTDRLPISFQRSPYRLPVECRRFTTSSTWCSASHCDNRRSCSGRRFWRVRLPPTTVLRMAASTLLTSESYLGAQFRRLRNRLGPPAATKAMAAKLAQLLYRMMRYRMKYADRGAQLYDAQYRKQQVTPLKRKAAQLGLQIIELAPAA